MAYYPIVQKNSRPVSTAGHRLLPTFYMEDFSVIGFRVNDCDQAIRLLGQLPFALKHAGGSIEVGIESASQMHEVMLLLNGNGLECEIADIAEEMYQG
jgi:hypothetical protein